MELLRTEVQEHVRIRARLSSNIDKVELTRIVDSVGQIGIPTDTIGLTLFNIDEERIMKTQGLAIRKEDGSYEYSQPEVRLNLYILFAANFSDYAEGLKFISYVISYFQKKRVLSHQNTPSLDPDLGELAVDMYAMTLEQQNYLWSIIGSKYLPSVAYQVRPVLIKDDEVELIGKPVMELELQEAPVFKES